MLELIPLAVERLILTYYPTEKRILTSAHVIATVASDSPVSWGPNMVDSRNVDQSLSSLD